jgi:CheY-specific phosphatase CheX
VSKEDLSLVSQAKVGIYGSLEGSLLPDVAADPAMAIASSASS